jgi:hypothetical protein
MGVAEIHFRNPSISCLIPYYEPGKKTWKTRTEHPKLGIFVYRIEDKTQLKKAEQPLRPLSSHCPRDLLLSETKKYFIAWSPCNQAYMRDKQCHSARRNIIESLRQHFKRFR